MPRVGVGHCKVLYGLSLLQHIRRIQQHAALPIPYTTFPNAHGSNTKFQRVASYPSK